MKQKIFIFIFIFILGLLLPMSMLRAYTVLSSHKYAWSDNVGYINFEGVIVDDDTLSGYAWSANKGFINLSPIQGGVSNDGTGNLSGSAWGEGLGWIDFNNVSINSSTGQFSGTATGDLIGTLTFDCSFCDVETDWRESSPVVILRGRRIAQISTSVVPFLPDLGTIEDVQVKQIDIQKDGIINILDFNSMMMNWGSTQNLASVVNVFNSADINSDGIVDVLDFNTLMIYWDITYQT